jgi:lactate dehydrogenase-like 2-hydroxyacid dehydrogenase
MATSRKTILALGSLLPPEMERLAGSFDILKLWKEPDPEAALQAARTNIVGILSVYNGMPVTPRILEALPNVEIIAQFGAGVDNIDVAFAKSRGIRVTSTPDAVTQDTADTALMLTLNLLRRGVEADMYVRVGKWAREGAFPLATSLTRKTVGILGLGRIGQAIATRMVACGMRVVYHGPNQKPALPYEFYKDLLEMARAVDVLVLACPGGEATKHLINYKVLENLGPKGYLVNIARGGVVNTDDLLIALENRLIAGAGLDVFETEPDVHPALINMDNVVLLPHIGGATLETRTRMGVEVAQNLINHFSGQALTGVVV